MAEQNDDVEGGNDFSQIYFTLNCTFIHFRSEYRDRKRQKRKKR